MAPLLCPYHDPCNLLVCAAVFAACSKDDAEHLISVECPQDIAANALSCAIEYVATDTEYEWGGQDLLKSIKIDCSGLIVNCYKYATAGTTYKLPFEDAAVIDFYTKWSVKIDVPRAGDLIFMGDNSNKPTHIALFVKMDDTCTYFIDATRIPENRVSYKPFGEQDWELICHPECAI